MSMRLSEAAAAMAGELHGGDATFAGVSTDTRRLTRRQLFFALRGPRFDGHDMLAAAAAGGAAAAVVARTSALPLKQIRTADPRRALGHLAQHWRQRFDLPVLAVTGSAGKTTVKEMLASIVRQRGAVLATRGNLNNDIGVPMTLFGLDATHAYAVLEMGADRPGDIAWLAAIARPDVAVVTLCAPAHLEGFGSIAGVARAKGEILSALAPGGVAVINADDEFAPLWRELAGGRRTITFGEAGEVRAHSIGTRDGRTCFVLVTDAGETAIAMAYRGAHNVRNALAAAAAARAAGLSPAEIAAGLAQAETVAGRLQIRRGAGGVRLIDDSYNANPASLRAALTVLADEPGRKWVVLGDMAELGDDAPGYHREAGAAVAAAGAERLFTIGELARHAGAEFTGEALHCADHAALLDSVQAALAEGGAGAPTILIKGSRVMALDRVADALAAGSATPC